MITRKEGKKLYAELGRLDTFGLSLSIEPSWASFEVKWEDGKPYWEIKAKYNYVSCFDDTPSFRVCLMQGGEALDARTIGLQYEVEANFNFGKRIDGINGKIDGISGTVRSLDGKVSGFETTINGFRTEVRDKVSHTELKQTADSFSLTVANGTRPNLLWGSDFDLDGVDTTNKRAIQKHLGVGLGEIKVDDAEYFQYLKGGGVAGSDAVMFKSKDGVARWTLFKWEKIKVKPNTVYTMSAWVKFKPNKANVNIIYTVVNETVSTQGLAFMEGSDVQYYVGEIKDWERRHWTFTTKNETLITVLFAHSGTDESLMWLCRPKLEEGDTATPWCAYDGTVEALLASGFSLKDKDFTATSDNFKVQNNKGEQTFFVDENGHINANLISAESLTAQKMSQPFVEQQSFGYLMSSPSLSWYITNVNNINGGYVLASELNGAVLNIYNYTTETIWFYSTLAVGKAIYPNKMVNVRVEIEPGAMFRAFGVPIKGVEMVTDNGTTTLVALVPLVPMVLTSLSGNMRAQYIGVVKGFLTIK